MKIFLDENFPLQLYRRLRLSDYEIEHIIMLGQRGIPDSAIRERISEEKIVFLTQHSEFEKMLGGHRGIVLISRIRQSLPIQKRIEIWFSAVEKFMAEKPSASFLSCWKPAKWLLGESIKPNNWSPQEIPQ